MLEKGFFGSFWLSSMHQSNFDEFSRREFGFEIWRAQDCGRQRNQSRFCLLKNLVSVWQFFAGFFPQELIGSSEYQIKIFRVVYNPSLLIKFGSNTFCVPSSIWDAHKVWWVMSGRAQKSDFFPSEICIFKTFAFSIETANESSPFRAETINWHSDT